MSEQRPQDATVLYKILTPEQHASLPTGESEKWAGAGIDLSDGFIHTSTSHQLTGTLSRFFGPDAGVGDTLYISELPVSTLQQRGYAVKWEAAAGTEFAHIYDHIAPGADFSAHHPIKRDEKTGQFSLPALQF